MARYIDADAALNKLPDDLPYKASVKRVLMSAPAAEVVEVVRCKDCVYWDGYGYSGRCETPTNGITRDLTNYDDFCSYGERKEGDKDEQL
jgi:hypothetical protein